MPKSVVVGVQKENPAGGSVGAAGRIAELTHARATHAANGSSHAYRLQMHPRLPLARPTSDDGHTRLARSNIARGPY